MSGSTAPGATVVVSRDNVWVARGSADTAGRFSLPVPLTAGGNRLVAVAEADGLQRAAREVTVTYAPPPPAAPAPAAPAPAPEATVPEASREPAVPPPLSAGNLADIVGHWAEADIRSLVTAGIVTGFPDQTFRPEDPVTREQFSVLLARALGLTADAAGPLPFADAAVIGDRATGRSVRSPPWSSRGWWGGDEDQTFRPQALITRGEMAVLVTRALAHLGVEVPVADTEAPPALAFTDQERIPAWSAPAIRTAAAAGLVGGFPDGTFRPDLPATRVQNRLLSAAPIR